MIIPIPVSPPTPPNPCEKRPRNCPKQWIYLPKGFRGDYSITSLVGLDFNLDFVTANYKPSQSSIIFTIAGQGGLSFGPGFSAGPLWHNTTCIEDYKSIDWTVGGTLLADFGGEGNWGWSSTTDSKLVYAGAGAGEEFSLAGTKTLLTWDILNGDVSFIGVDGIWQPYSPLVEGN